MEYTFKLLAALLDYPNELTLRIVNEIDEIVKDCTFLDEESRKCTIDFAMVHRGIDLLQWQQAYSAIFDVAPVTSLYLFEHIYGESRKRGAAMSSLKATYSDYGLEISNCELPDYLPVYLDFISRLDDTKESLSYLADISTIITSIYGSLKKNGSDYAMLIEPLIKLAERGEAHPLPDTENKEIDCPLAH